MPNIFDVGTLQRALDFHSERHAVIASNIANANTPGFKPMELLRAEQKELGGTLPLARTQGAHLTSANDPSVYTAEAIPDESNIGGLDGNNVSLEREMSKMQANDLHFQGAAKLVTRQLALLRYAATDGNG